MEKREKVAGIIILVIGLTGFIFSLFLNLLHLSPITMLILWSSVICRIFLKQNRLFGMLLILATLTLPFNTSQIPFLFLATGMFFNGLVIMVNKGMPVHGLEFSEGIHIPMDGAKLTFLGDLSVLGKWSVGDLFIINFLWSHLLLFWLS
ncbi:MAG: hypothetical protein HY505_00680 [Candidatus Yanofskybacteria bacterium]|nr:hypothetical protein [Candidatus Yanofskybacteria bacterium]